MPTQEIWLLGLRLSESVSEKYKTTAIVCEKTASSPRPSPPEEEREKTAASQHLSAFPITLTLPTNLPLGTLEGASSPQTSPQKEERERISQTRSNGIPIPNPLFCPRTKISWPTGRAPVVSNQQNTV